MGLLEQEIKELRDLQKKVMAGEVSMDQAAMQISISNQVAKRETLIYNIMALNAKFGSKALKPIVGTNLIGNGTAIEVSGEIEEKIVCPEQGGKCINREECLDYSGSSHNIDKCQKCDQFEITRKQF
jgi:hypothetical protein